MGWCPQVCRCDMAPVADTLGRRRKEKKEAREKEEKDIKRGGREKIERR